MLLAGNEVRGSGLGICADFVQEEMKRNYEGKIH